jgi:hypothetical protein
MDADLDWDMCDKESAASRSVNDGSGPFSLFLQEEPSVGSCFIIDSLQILN